MIDREHELPTARQAKALGIGRGSVYYLPRPVPAADLSVMRRMDEWPLDRPFVGRRMLRDLLNKEGIAIGRCHVATPMKRLRIEALWRKPGTSKPAPGHKIDPYPLRGLTIDRPDHVWAMDITYVPMARGFVHLAAIIDWYSRKGLSCSTDGKGAWRDTVFADAALRGVERLWRSVTYEETSLHAATTPSARRAPRSADIPPSTTGARPTSLLRQAAAARGRLNPAEIQ